MQMTNGIPRRCDVQQHTPVEAMITNAMRGVENMGADPLLTDAVVLLEQARNKVADYVEKPTE